MISSRLIKKSKELKQLSSIGKLINLIQSIVNTMILTKKKNIISNNLSVIRLPFSKREED